MTRGIVLLTLLLLATAGAAAAQTTTPTPTPAPSTQGAFAALSPGNQKIAQALFDGQATAPTGTPLTRDEIAAMHAGGGKGWGVIFKEMKAQGLVDAKNLGQLVSRSGRSHVDTRVRTESGTLAEAEQTLFDPQGGLTTRDQAFEARFRDVRLTGADRERFLVDVQELRDIPEGSRVRFDGRIDGRPFRAEVRNHKGEIEVQTRGISFDSRADAQQFMDGLAQDGASRVRVRGTIDGQRFDARFRDHGGRVEQRFTVKGGERGTRSGGITTGSNRTIETGSGRSGHGGGSDVNGRGRHGGGDDPVVSAGGSGGATSGSRSGISGGGHGSRGGGVVSAGGSASGGGHGGGGSNSGSGRSGGGSGGSGRH